MNENSTDKDYSKGIKKVLILVPDLHLPGGVSNYYNTLKLNSESYIHYFPVNKGKPKTSLAIIWRLFRNYCRFFFLIIRNRYDLIHLNPSLDQNSFYRDAFFIIISRVLNKKTLVFFRGWKDHFEEKIKKEKIKSFLFRISYAKANKYIVLGHVFKVKLIGMGVPSETEFFIETTVADSSYLSELDLVSKYKSFKREKTFLFLSRIERDKGVYIAIDAFAEFLEKCSEKKSFLIVAGEGSELGAVKKYVSEKRFPNIKFTGHVKGEIKKNLLLASHIMLFPTYYGEGLPNSILEGMLYGMPVVSRGAGGIPDVVQQNVNGFLSDSLQPKVFADFLFLLTSDPGLYEKVARNNHELAMERFTTEKVKERILKIYQEFN